MVSSSESEITGQIKRGFVWLGGASILTRVLDASSTLGVLWLVTQEDLGLATLAWSIAVFIEAFNGFGIATALVQAPEVDEDLQSDAFWYVMGVAVLLVVSVFVLAPWLSVLWDAPALTPLIRASSIKVLFMGAALVPMQMLNRALRFERIALLNTLGTFSTAASTLAFAWAGFGPWAFVLGQVVYGVVIAVVAFALHPFRPRFTFRLARVRPLIVFGARAAGATIVYHLYRNADYFIMGRFLGVAAVGVYRVGFELAMTPTVTLLNIVNRTALPAYSKLQQDRAALTRAFYWTSKSLILMLAPVTAFLVFASGDVLALINDGEWIDAATVTPWLAVAALLRSLSHLFPQIFYAVGRPTLALFEALASALVLCACFAGGLALYGADYGILTVGWAWFAGGALLLVLLFRLTQRVVPLSLSAMLETLAPALGGLAAMFALGIVLGWLIPEETPPLAALLSRLCLFLLGYFAFLRIGLHMRFSDLRTRAPVAAPG